MPAWIHSVARQLGATTTAVRLATRALSPLDTNPVPNDWQHITKIDPEDEKKLPVLFPLSLQHTDAVSVGGSADVTAENTRQTFELLSSIQTLPTFHEPSAAQHVTEQTRNMSEFLAIPEVLNGDSKSLVGTLGEGTVHLKEQVVPEQLRRVLPKWILDRWGEQLADFGATWALSNAVFEAYIIQNPDSAAAREANVSETDVLSPTAAKQRALAAEKHLSSEVIYVEYSGTFGEAEGISTVATIRDALSWSRLWYGGGLDSRENAVAMIDAGADAVIVGNVFHEIALEERQYFERALAELGPAATFEDIASWLADDAIEESNTAKYLSTILTVSDPVKMARRYLARTIYVLIQLASVRDELVEQSSSSLTAEHLRDAVETSSWFDEAVEVLEPTMGEEARSYVLDFSLAWLCDHLDIDVTTELPVSHALFAQDE